MNELLKPLLTWFAGLFNLGIYMTDGVDSMLIKLQILKQIHLTNEMEQLHHTMQFLEVTKVVLMTLSFLSILILNYSEIKKDTLVLFEWFKKGFKKVRLFFKRFFTNLFSKNNKNN